jgi:hypothetical protein
MQGKNMSYLVFVTFDLKNASSADYQDAYADLSNLGLERVVAVGSGNDVVIPTTSVLGKYNGGTAAAVRDKVKVEVKDAFSGRGFDSEIFVIVGGDWAWGASST